jgi:hypothetical protein
MPKKGDHMKRKRKRVHFGGKEERIREDVLSQPSGQSGERLETFCEHADVGMEGIAHWNDAHAEVSDVYSLTLWLEFDGNQRDIPFTSPEHKEINLLSSGRHNAFHNISLNVMADDGYLSPQGICQGEGYLRYDKPDRDAPGAEGLNLSFDDVSNLGLGSTLILF